MAKPGRDGIELNEYALIQELARRPDQTQRELAQRVGLSLGMTNILLVRLARKGYIKVRQLDWKRTEYLLTLRGAMEKTRKTYSYVRHTIALFQAIMERVQTVVRREHDAGLRRFVIVAWPETASAISRGIAELGLGNVEVEFVESFAELGRRPGTAFTATEEPAPAPAPGQRWVPLLDESLLKFRFPQ